MLLSVYAALYTYEQRVCWWFQLENQVCVSFFYGVVIIFDLKLQRRSLADFNASISRYTYKIGKVDKLPGPENCRHYNLHAQWHTMKIIPAKDSAESIFQFQSASFRNVMLAHQLAENLLPNIWTGNDSLFKDLNIKVSRIDVLAW